MNSATSLKSVCQSKNLPITYARSLGSSNHP
jgi:hypothetical protein